jgi:hypothetical protein
VILSFSKSFKLLRLLLKNFTVLSARRHFSRFFEERTILQAGGVDEMTLKKQINGSGFRVNLEPFV